MEYALYWYARALSGVTMKKIELGDGIAVVDVPEAGLSILCACPENAVKFLIKGGVIHQVADGDVPYESGPNAILLSELPVQNGRFSNLAEFPVLQMLYRQGMMIPGHPNNHGIRPMLIGLRDQVEAQARYIYLGNYGITDPAVLAPEDPEGAARVIRMKRKFAFGSFKRTDELLDLRILDGTIVELRGGVFLRRLGVNRYEFIHHGDAIQVDLNLRPGQSYGAPYRLPKSKTGRDDFCVIHLGEGDGWDPDRPCMGSLVIHEGRPYLVDAGPNIEESLDAVGLGVGDLAGIFHTHVHDDHFVGLTSLMRSDRRIPYFAVPMVRRSATEKLGALCGIGESDFGRFFDVRDLELGRWNDVDGMLVEPLLSPHPIETTIMRFRVLGAGGPRTYAHFADLSSFAVLDSLVTDDDAPGITAAEAAAAKAAYLEPADLKKVDVGGGMIHGDMTDFNHDASAELLFSHGDSVDAIRTSRIGRVAKFGEASVLIHASRDWVPAIAIRSFGQYFPDASDEAIAALAASPRLRLEAGAALTVRGEAAEAAWLAIDGGVERLGASGEVTASYGSGALVGLEEAVDGRSYAATYRLATDAEAMAVPASLFATLPGLGMIAEDLDKMESALAELSGSVVFSGLRSLSRLHEIARSSRVVNFRAGESLAGAECPSFFLLVSGQAAIIYGGNDVETIGSGDVFGEESVVCGMERSFTSRCLGPVAALEVQAAVVEETPTLLWRLREILDRRLALVKASFGFEWRPEYAMGIAMIDGQHRGLVDCIDEVVARPGADIEIGLERIFMLFAEHFAFEEQLQASAAYPELAEHARAHERFLRDLDDYRGQVRSGLRLAIFSEALKDYLIRHTLLMDRNYQPWVERFLGIDGDSSRLCP
ncbi:MAG: cyclic nucleotide-binding protein [Spirochaetae bacterium HGW-Spirochaetae-7]|nr:MAG: cyclic nucleotide-binding protein [Spirochaetae bacterium HGW-Spirochaetae-7]